MNTTIGIAVVLMSIVVLFPVVVIIIDLNLKKGETMDLPKLEKEHQRKLLEEHMTRLNRDIEATKHAIASLEKEPEFVSYEEFIKLFKEYDVRVHVDVPAEIGVQNWWEREAHKTMWLVKHKRDSEIFDRREQDYAWFFKERGKGLPMKFTGLNLFSIYKTLREREVKTIVTMNGATALDLMK